MSSEFSPIIQVADLKDLHQNKEVVILDVSNAKDAQSNYAEKHLDGAIFVDLNTQLADIKEDLSKGGRHPLPTIENFSKVVSSLGITPSKHVVLYDNKSGANAAARMWWMLKSIGHTKVQVLNGGFQEAERQKFPINSKSVIPGPVNEFPFEDWKLPVATLNEVEEASKSGNKLLIDVRETDRFNGITEPIDLIAGHIPNAINSPFSTNLDENGLFHSPQTLKEHYKNVLHSYPSQEVIVHCGSGVTACHTLLAMSYAGFEIPKLYVGSWSEWSRNNLPIAVEKGS
jgi:thiosulfate/3-mercaptopyruvate sulfurtransferase